MRCETISRQILLSLCLVFLSGCKYSLHLLGRQGETGLGTGNNAPALIRTMPAEHAVAIGTNTKIHITFDATMEPGTVTVNTADSSCSGTVQLSSDGFTTCVQIASVQAAFANTLFSLTPATNLAANTRYKLRVTAAAKSAAGLPLAKGFESGNGFITTSAADTRAPVVQTALASFISPFDTATNVPLNTGISVQFSEPVDPTTLTVNTADSSCSGNIQLSQNLFASCLPMRGSVAPATDGRLFTVFPAAPLSASTAYRIRLTTGVRDLSGNGLASALVTNFSSGTGAENSAFSILSITPANGATGIAVTTSITIAFAAGRYVDAASIAVNMTDSTCSGSIQLSADNFGNCIPLIVLFVGPDFENVGLRVASPLQNSTTYKIRVTADLRDVYGNSIAAVTQAAGFTTTATVTGGGSVAFLEPGDNSGASNDIYGAFTVNFTRVMNPATLTVVTAGTACTGSFMVSADNFSTCLPMSAQPLASSGNTRFTVLPQSPLSASGIYRTRISAAAQDAGGAAISLYTGNGITVMP